MGFSEVVANCASIVSSGCETRLISAWKEALLISARKETKLISAWKEAHLISAWKEARLISAWKARLGIVCGAQRRGRERLEDVSSGSIAVIKLSTTRYDASGG